MVSNDSVGCKGHHGDPRPAGAGSAAPGGRPVNIRRPLRILLYAVALVAAAWIGLVVILLVASGLHP